MEYLEKVAHKLRKNNIQAFVVSKKEDVLSVILDLIKNGDIVSNGGSESIKECGVMDLLKSGDYKYIDRTAMEPRDAYIAAFDTDVYFCSSNAVTENGELYNVDGNSNRIAAISYGPKSVVMIVGKNKIVKNIDEAIHRVKEIAAPKNTIRLDLDTYCNKTGKCVSLENDNAQMCSGCSSDGRICCNYLVSAQQRHKNRIKVILVNEVLGY